MQAAVDHRLERGQRLRRGLAQALVALDGCGLAGRLPVRVQHRRLDRHDLAVEVPACPGGGRVALRAQAERVQVGPGQAAPLRDPLGRDELVGHVDRPRRRARACPAGHGAGAERHPAHRLDAARDADVDRVGGDQPGDQMGGLLG